MYKKDIVNTLTSKLGCSKHQGTKILNAVLDSIAEGITTGDKVVLRDFGRFYVSEGKAGVMYNPYTRKKVQLTTKRRKVYFVSSLTLKKAIKEVK